MVKHVTKNIKQARKEGSLARVLSVAPGQIYSWTFLASIIRLLQLSFSLKKASRLALQTLWPCNSDL